MYRFLPAVLIASAAGLIWSDLNAHDDPRTILGTMTVAEKLGQLNQMAGGRSKALNSRIDETELERIRSGHVGSYLHVAGAEFLGDLQRIAVEESRLGIPLLFAMDVVHGYRTIFPVPLAMASSWDPELVEQAASVAANEASASGLHWTFAPMVDIARDPRWGRVVEGAGEDPFLGAAMARAQVVGYQGDDLASPATILAATKHFGAYGAGIGGRDYNSSDISERALHEIYLPPFYAAHDAGGLSFMTAFNDVAGVPMTAHRRFLRDVLREGWGFDGILISDWNAVAELINHGVAENPQQAALLALEAGIDVDMISGAMHGELASVVEADPDAMALLDEAVLRILTVKQRLGLFDNPYQYHDVNREQAVILSPQHRDQARLAAQRSMVLLQNDGSLLPLSKDIETIAVIGALADDSLSQLGSWRAQGQAGDVVSLLDGIRAAAPDANVKYVAAAANRMSDRDLIDQAVSVARQADVVILVVGEDYDYSGEARSRSSLDLPDPQRELVPALDGVDVPTVALLVNGRPLVTAEVSAVADAIIETWFLGVEAGNAVADVLFGDVSPAGRLPVTFPRVTGQVPITYSALPTGRPADPDLSRDTVRYMDIPITPQFAFGHGLSYTRFAYADFSLSSETVGAQGTVEAAVTITNIGERGGDEVVQLYFRDPVASVSRPVLELRGFKRIHVPRGQSRRVTFSLTVDQFALLDHDGNWTTEPGEIEIHIGAASDDLRVGGSVRVVDAVTSDRPPAAMPTKVDVDTVEFHLGALIAEGAEPEIIAEGTNWAEGPVWIENGGYLLYSDVPANRVYRWDSESGASVFLDPSGYAGPATDIFREPGINGMIVDPAEDALIAADHGTRAVVRMRMDALEKESLATAYEGQPLNSPNDVILHPDGMVFFTDPPYGLAGLNASPHKRQPHNGVYRIDIDGSVHLIDGTLTFPNGIALSPDARTLYVSNSDPDRPVWMRYELDAQGNVLDQGVLFDGSELAADYPGLPDGMAVDAKGNLFATGPGGVLVLTPTGEHMATLDVGAIAANCAFGEDGSTLFVTADDRVARIATLTSGLHFSRR